MLDKDEHGHDSEAGRNKPVDQSATTALRIFEGLIQERRLTCQS
jgi:hypothetical protein